MENCNNLIIDIGNTRAKILIFNGNKIIEKIYDESGTLKHLDNVCLRHQPRHGIISSVGKLGEEALKRVNSLPIDITWLTSSTQLPFPIYFHRPGCDTREPIPPTMGADRIAALIGAVSLMPGCPLLIIDAGTCVTYEVIGEDGCYLGGNIAPGLEMRMASMHEHTALLPLFSADGEKPELGYDTETAMRCGACHGLQYEMEGYIRYWAGRLHGLQIFLASAVSFEFSSDIQDRIHTEGNLVPYGLNAILKGLQD